MAEPPRERPLAVAVNPNPNPPNAHQTQTPPTSGGDGVSATNNAPKDQLPGHPSFRRQRASRACEVGRIEPGHGYVEMPYN